MEGIEMTIEEQLKQMMINHSGSINKFASDVGLPYSTVASILNRGVKNANVQNIIKVCHALNISADELANGRITTTWDLLVKNKESTVPFDFFKLTPENQARLIAYYQGLIDTQGE